MITKILIFDEKKNKKELGFGWGDFWIGLGFFQGLILMVFSVILDKSDIPPLLGLIMSGLAFGYAYGLLQRKLYGLYLTYAIIIVNFGVGGVWFLLSYELVSRLMGIGFLIVGVLWWIYFNKRRSN